MPIVVWTAIVDLVAVESGHFAVFVRTTFLFSSRAPKTPDSGSSRRELFKPSVNSDFG